MNKNNKEKRIWSRKEIASLLREGKRQRCENFYVVFKINEHPYDRMAVLVSRRHGNAVARNRIKRLAREAFRAGKVGDPPHYNILIRPRENEFKDIHALKEAYRAWRKSLKKQ